MIVQIIGWFAVLFWFLFFIRFWNDEQTEDGGVSALFLIVAAICFK